MAQRACIEYVTGRAEILVFVYITLDGATHLPGTMVYLALKDDLMACLQCMGASLCGHSLYACSCHYEQTIDSIKANNASTLKSTD